MHGVIAASTGNHASAMAYHGSQSGTDVTVVMPTRTPLPKIKNCLSFGAQIILKGNSIAEVMLPFLISLAMQRQDV